MERESLGLAREGRPGDEAIQEDLHSRYVLDQCGDITLLLCRHEWRCWRKLLIGSQH